MTRNPTRLARLAAAGLLAFLALPTVAALPLGLGGATSVPLPIAPPSINQTVDTPLGQAYVDSDNRAAGADLATPGLPVPVAAAASLHVKAGMDGVTAGADADAQAAHLGAGADASADAGQKGVMARIGSWFKGIFG